MKADKEAFWPEERRVIVYQPEVWVVMGARIGMDYAYAPYKLSGTVRHLPHTNQTVWVRLSSIYSSLLADARGIFNRALDTLPECQ